MAQLFSEISHSWHLEEGHSSSTNNLNTMHLDLLRCKYRHNWNVTTIGENDNVTDWNTYCPTLMEEDAKIEACNL